MSDASTLTLGEKLASAERTLTELSSQQGDRTLWRMVAIWRDRAERDGMQLALAERALRRLLAGENADDEVAAWRRVSAVRS